MNCGRLSGTALFLVLAVLLGGCVNVPTSGPIERVKGAQQSCQNCVAVEVLPPSPGDDPQQIVDGFLRANAIYQPTYDVAKRYLTRESAQSWKPQAGVTVYNGTTTIEGSDRVRLTGRTVGAVAADRSYTAIGGKLDQPFTLVRQDGEWRIDAPPAGLLVAYYSFAQFYAPYDLFFLANGRPDGQTGAAQSPVLVPDPIYLPKFRSPDSVASALVKQLLVGPTTWLAGSVTTAVPPETTLSVDSVTIANGVAAVSLSDTVLALPDTQRSLLAAQIVYTLKEAVAIQGVSITVNQQGFRVPESDPTTLVVPTTSISSQLDPISPNAGNQLYVVSKGRVALVDAGTGQLRDFAGQLGSDVRSLAVSVTDTDLAAVTSRGTRLVQTPTAAAGAQARTVLSGVEGLARPQFTRFGELWALGREGGRQRLWWIAGDKVNAVDAPELAERDITAFRLSPDGVRIAFLVRTANGSRIAVARVERGERVSVEDLRALDTRQTGTSPLTQFKDLSWVDATHLLVLASDKENETASPYAISEDASTITNQGEVLSWDPDNVAVLLRTQSAIIRSSNGQTWQDQGTTWIPFVKDVDALAYPG